MLESYIRAQRAQQDILLMTHLVLGYPSFEANRQLIAQMAGAGVELIELQIPFSEPMADGPVILKANDEALKAGTTVTACLDFARDIWAAYPDLPFLFMTYGNVLFAAGVEAFLTKARQCGIRGLIVPDLPPDEGDAYLAACRQQQLDPIMIFTPTNTPERLQTLAAVASGFVYCIGRRGVTGTKTDFSANLQQQLAIYQKATDLPLALGFGIRERADVDFLRGKADIAVLGTQVLRIQQDQGTAAVGPFLQTLRP